MKELKKESSVTGGELGKDSNLPHTEDFNASGDKALGNSTIASDSDSVKSDVLAQLADTPSMAEVRRKYEGTDKWMKAPNGERSNLPERQWLQVRTPQFKRWFGDWENDPAHASKVVDGNGEPLVVDGLFLNLSSDTAIRKARQRVSKAEALANRVRKAEEATGTDAGTIEFGYAASDVSEAYALADPDVGILTDAILKGRNPRLTVGFQYGEVPAEMQSRNYRDDSLERGVSIVGHVKDLDTRRSAYYDAFWGSGNYNIVPGVDVGNTGGDGEILLSPAYKIGTAEDAGQIIKSATDTNGAFCLNFRKKASGTACDRWISPQGKTSAGKWPVSSREQARPCGRTGQGHREDLCRFSVHVGLEYETQQPCRCLRRVGGQAWKPSHGP